MYQLSIPRFGANFLFNARGFRELDTLVEQAFDNDAFSLSRYFDLDETENGYSLVLELPGFKQQDLDVGVEKQVLSVKAKRGEREYSTAVTLPSDVDVEKIDAKLEDGLLIITLERNALSKPRKVTVK